MRIAAFLLITLLCAAGTLAQQRTDDATSGPARQATATRATNTGPITLRGCINGGAQRYTFMQQSTGAVFSLEGDRSRFEHFRGKAVELTGHESPPAGATGVNYLPELRVDDIKVLAAKCPIQSSGPAATTAQPPLQNRGERPPSSPATPRYGGAGAPTQTPPAVGNNPNQPGITGAPSPGTGNPPPPPPPQP